MVATVDKQTAPDEERLEFHRDVLETVFSNVPLVHLVSTSHVSKAWSHAVSSSLRHCNRPRPWLILHSQSTRPPYATATRAYDPRSSAWVEIPSRPPVPYVSTLKSSNSSFAYMLSPLRFSFSSDPLNSYWRHVEPPAVWRRDPIVARVGDSVVIAGGGCDFEDDPLAVEIYDLNARVWRTCDSMPGALRDSAASPWLSIAATGEKLIVADKESGLTHWFDPETKTWSKPFRLSPPGQPVTKYNIGCTNNNSLILVGLCTIQNVERVKIWGVFGEEFECEEIGEMPMEYVEKLRSESFGFCSLNIRAAGNIVYVYNDTWGVEEVVACELVDGGACSWWSVGNVAAREGSTAERLVFTCSEVGIEELRRVIREEKWSFEVSPLE
ncbi:F-box/kelch-repeat protein at1g23390 [Phtheirospermum japonicum]|uniref:F-box/kelch-repeat protein at1g23390 n=1 Tax=Phtheirospermum japonicum TaxID=374723 RepID=A0A830BQG1_9LAMI|nr:F-box/kelch-repeat protein at1g23390 [Phtheirospermum japonicum]